MTDTTVKRVEARPRRRINYLPYLLSLPALLVCIGILIPFFTAVYYSTLRFRLNLPGLKGYIGLDNYINFLSDAAFWNTVTFSLPLDFFSTISAQGRNTFWLTWVGGPQCDSRSSMVWAADRILGDPGHAERMGRRGRRGGRGGETSVMWGEVARRYLDLVAACFPELTEQRW